MRAIVAIVLMLALVGVITLGVVDGKKAPVEDDDDQGENIDDQGENIDDQGENIDDQGENINDQGENINDQG